MPLADRGLIFELVEQPTVLSDTTAIDFRRAAHYATDTVVLDGEQAVARRYATAANREGIRRVELHAFAAAARAFTRAVRHDPAYAQPWLNLGLLEADYLGDPGAARRAWQRYLALADESSETAAVRRRLAALPPAP